MIVEQFDSDLTPMRALDLADALGGFLDSCQLEEIPNPERIATLVDGEMAEHWERSAEFLGLAVTAWPKRLAELGLVDPAWRRAALLRRLAELWDAHPPIQAVIAAGSTGTVPAAGDVLRAVAKAPLGCVVLPGLDLDLDAGVWDQLDEQHPQSAMKRLLDRCEIARESVRPWFRPAVSPAVEARGLARQRLVNEALRPAEATDDWRGAIRDIRAAAVARGEARDPIGEGLQGLSLLTVRAEEEAAAAIALMMRETLETPGRTCALVTPDQALGRRVAARLERWGVIADSSPAPLCRACPPAPWSTCARAGWPIRSSRICCWPSSNIPWPGSIWGRPRRRRPSRRWRSTPCAVPARATSPPSVAACWRRSSPTDAARPRSSGNRPGCPPRPGWSITFIPPSRPRPPPSRQTLI